MLRSLIGNLGNNWPALGPSGGVCPDRRESSGAGKHNTFDEAGAACGVMVCPVGAPQSNWVIIELSAALGCARRLCAIIGVCEEGVMGGVYRVTVSRGHRVVGLLGYGQA